MVGMQRRKNRMEGNGNIHIQLTPRSIHTLKLHTYTHVLKHRHTSTQTHSNTPTQAHTGTHSQTHTRRYIQTHTHRYTQTHIETPKHTLKISCSPSPCNSIENTRRLNVTQQTQQKMIIKIYWTDALSPTLL